MSEYLTQNPNLQVVEKFVVNGWRGGRKARVVEEIISTHNESHRMTDPYTFYFDQKGFYMLDEDSNKDYVKETMENTSQTGQIEGEILNNLELWFENSVGGKILWFSPPSPGKYRDWKLITHEIKEDAISGKTLHNRVDLFKAHDSTAMQIVHDFFPHTSEITNAENIRPHLFLVDEDFDLQEIFDRIKEIDPDSFAKNTGLNEEQIYKRASHIANLIESGANERYIALEMQRLELLGKHDISCPGSQTLSEILTGSAGSDEFGSLEFPCPSCGAANIRPPGKLISNCQHCGADVTC